MHGSPSECATSRTLSLYLRSRWIIYQAESDLPGREKDLAEGFWYPWRKPRQLLGRWISLRTPFAINQCRRRFLSALTSKSELTACPDMGQTKPFDEFMAPQQKRILLSPKMDAERHTCWLRTIRAAHMFCHLSARPRLRVAVNRRSLGCVSFMKPSRMNCEWSVQPKASSATWSIGNLKKKRDPAIRSSPTRSKVF